MLVIGGIAAALIANALIVHTIRNTIGVHHPKTRSLLTQVIMTVAAAMMSFEQVRQYGVSLFASAGVVAGLAIGLASRPLLSNLIAGVQIAVAQPACSRSGNRPRSA